MSPLLLAAGMGALQALVLQVLAFAILLGILIKWVVPVLGKILGRRSQEVADTFTEIEEGTARAAKGLQEIKQKVSETAQEAQRRQKAALEDAQRTRAQALADAAAQSQGLLEKARHEIEIEHEKAILELRQETENLTLKAADHLIRATLNEPIHEKLVDNYLGRIEEVKRS